MNEEFLQQFQKKPRPEFGNALFERLQAQDKAGAAPTSAPWNSRDGHPRPEEQSEEDNDMFATYTPRRMAMPAQFGHNWLVASVAAVFTLILTAFIILNALNNSIFVLFSDEEKNTAVFERYIEEAWNIGDTTMLEEILTDGYIRHDPLFDNDLMGIVGEQEAIMLLRNAAPDLQVTIDDLIAQEDVIWAQLTITGTQETAIELDIIPVIPGLGNTFTFTTHNMVRFTDEKMVEMWVELDPQGFVEQLGVMPHLLTVEHNDDWTPIIREFNGVEMVLVPAGRFMMGMIEEEKDPIYQICAEGGGKEFCRSLVDGSGPIHEIYIDQPFWIDRYEITNQQFEQFDGKAGFKSIITDPSYPRNRISWNEAKTFCEVRGSRLPTEAEWEYAATGPDSLAYPWGNEFDGTLLNFCDKNCDGRDGMPPDPNFDDGYATTAPVGTYSPAGDSWVGAADMAGNVSEWTSTIYGFPYPYDPTDGREDINASNVNWVMRGGAWQVAGAAAHSAFHTYNGSRDGNYLGFRCVMDFDGVLDMQELPGTVLPPEMTTNEDVYKQYINEVWNNDNLDALVYLLADDYIRNDPLFDDEMTAIALFRNAMPDMEINIDTLMSTHDTVWAQVTLTGTHTGLFAVDTTMIPASGNEISINMTHVVKFDGKQMKSTRVQLNTLELMDQLGVDVVLQAVAHNDDWTPVIREFNGVEMVLVPAGVYMMGATEEQLDMIVEECTKKLRQTYDWCLVFRALGPVHQVVIEQPFWIDIYEVSNAQFEQFGGEARDTSSVTDPNYPRTEINWDEANAFCELRGARLATGAEFEYAARGPDSLVYPYGNEFDPTRVNYCDVNCTETWKDRDHDDGYRYTSPVDAFSPAGDSWVGAAEMASNVWEWTSTISRPYPYDPDDGREDEPGEGDQMEARGGGYQIYPINSISAARGTGLTSLRSEPGGFRCARDYEGE